MKAWNTIKEFAVITVGTAIVAAAVFFFMLPSHVSVGSATALAMVMSNFIPLSVSAITFVLNVGLLLIGFLLIGPEFGIKTVYCAVLLPTLIHGFYDYIAIGSGEQVLGTFVVFVLIVFIAAFLLVRRLSKRDRYIKF